VKFIIKYRNKIDENKETNDGSGFLYLEERFYKFWQIIKVQNYFYD